MASFLIHFSVLDASPEENIMLTDTMNKAGFLSTIGGSNDLKYRLPTSVYQCAGPITKSQILDCTKRIALHSGKRIRIVVTESVASAWVGLELIGRESSDAPEMILATLNENLPPTRKLRTKPSRRATHEVRTKTAPVVTP